MNHHLSFLKRLPGYGWLVIVGLYFSVPALGQWAEVQQLTPADPTPSFGATLAVSASGTVVVCGAPYDDENGPGSGSAHIYERRPDSSWRQVQKLTPPDVAAENLYGFSAAVSASGEVLALGALYADAHLGRVFVYQRQSKGGWQLAISFAGPGPGPASKFGSSLAVSPAGSRILVGAPGYEQKDRLPPRRTGAAFLYRRGSEDWNTYEEIRLDPPDFPGGCWFGHSVALTEEYALVTAPMDDEAGIRAGAVYAYRFLPDGQVRPVQKLAAADRQDGLQLGMQIAMDGQLAAVATNSRPSKGYAGSIYVFELSEEERWQQIGQLTPPEGTAPEGCRTVAVSGQTVLIGSNADQAMYLFQRQADRSWAEVQKLQATDGVRFLTGKVALADAGSLAFAAARPLLPGAGLATYIFRRSGGVVGDRGFGDLPEEKL